MGPNGPPRRAAAIAGCGRFWRIDDTVASAARLQQLELPAEVLPLRGRLTPVLPARPGGEFAWTVLASTDQGTMTVRIAESGMRSRAVTVNDGTPDPGWLLTGFATDGEGSAFVRSRAVQRDGVFYHEHKLTEWGFRIQNENLQTTPYPPTMSPGSGQPGRVGFALKRWEFYVCTATRGVVNVSLYTSTQESASLVGTLPGLDPSIEHCYLANINGTVVGIASSDTGAHAAFTVQAELRAAAGGLSRLMPALTSMSPQPYFSPLSAELVGRVETPLNLAFGGSILPASGGAVLYSHLRGGSAGGRVMLAAWVSPTLQLESVPNFLTGLQVPQDEQVWGSAIATSPENQMIAAITTDRGVYISSPSCVR